jgi:hypothetical protein
MDSLVARCAFCGKRHLVDIEGLDVWFAQCECGAAGFVQDDRELYESGHLGVGFTVQEVTTIHGVHILLSDPLPVYVDGLGCRWYVCWYMLQ